MSMEIEVSIVKDETLETLKEKMYHIELMNKLLTAENEALKEVIKECKRIPIKATKMTLKDRIRGTVFYRALKKVKYMIVGDK